jgi:hypothetical protein
MLGSKVPVNGKGEGLCWGDPGLCSYVDKRGTDCSSKHGGGAIIGEAKPLLEVLATVQLSLTSNAAIDGASGASLNKVGVISFTFLSVLCGRGGQRTNQTDEESFNVWLLAGRWVET